MVSPGSQRQRFFLTSQKTFESINCDSTALITKIGGLFFLTIMRPTSMESKGTLIRTNLALGVAACQASAPAPKITRRLWLWPGSFLLLLAVILGSPNPK